MESIFILLEYLIKNPKRIIKVSGFDKSVTANIGGNEVKVFMSFSHSIMDVDWTIHVLLNDTPLGGNSCCFVDNGERKRLQLTFDRLDMANRRYRQEIADYFKDKFWDSKNYDTVELIANFNN
jgi:hypothetical protein